MRIASASAKVLCLAGVTLLSACVTTTGPGGSGGRRDASLANRDFVLHRMETASKAMKANRKSEAALALDETISSIESVFGFDEAAAKARSTWHEEGCKVFKGEPYERAMAYYYRGLLYLDQGDVDNARACFKGGLLQDTIAEETQYRCDFALLMMLQYWTSLHLKDADDMAAVRKELAAVRPALRLPPDGHNVLFLAETGTSPRKLPDGVGGYKLVYRRGKYFTETKARLVLGDTGGRPMQQVENIFFQATTRGGRVVDSILEGKAVFQQNMTDIGKRLSDMGNTAVVLAPMSRGHTAKWGNIGAGLSILGAGMQLVAMNAKPRADTRYWHGLPDAVHASTARLPAGTHSGTIQFLDRSGRLVPGLSKTFTVSVKVGHPALVWVSAR